MRPRSVLCDGISWRICSTDALQAGTLIAASDAIQAQVMADAVNARRGAATGGTVLTEVMRPSTPLVSSPVIGAATVVGNPFGTAGGRVPPGLP
jgi:hypothetical protein